MFQLVLTDKLRSYLTAVGEGQGEQPVIFDKQTSRMAAMPGYAKDARADNVRVFQVREVPDAAGGMNFVLQLSLANEEDPEGWTAAEIGEYDGWGKDSGRTWRKGERLESEGFSTFRKRFGP